VTYTRLRSRASYYRRTGRLKAAGELMKAVRKLPSVDTRDSSFRRLRYVRYADDFLLGFAGPEAEAKQVKEEIREFLRDELKLEQSEAKTLVTHARTEKAKFLNYEVHTLADDTYRGPGTEKEGSTDGSG
jgi:hypothetical protein